jgi:putative tricarboxylic transport membrane protein
MKKLISARVKMSMIMFVIVSLLLGAASIQAAEYPRKPIKVIVPYNVGGGVDTFARAVSEYSKEYFGQKMIILNKKGAGGEIGWNAFAKSKPDGYTLTATVLPNIIYQPGSRAKGISGYQVSDFVHIGTLVQVPTGVFVKKDSVYKNWKEVVDDAKKRPGKISIGISGSKNVTHGFLLQVEKAAGIKFTSVTYTGGAPLLKDTIGGHVQLMIANAMYLDKAKDTLKCLGLAASKRYAFHPEVLTLSEQGTPVVDFLTRGLAAPKGTPPEIISYLQNGLEKLTINKKFIKKMKRIGLPVNFLDSENSIELVKDFREKKGWVIEEFQK